MQADTISRLQNMSSIVKTPSPLSGVQSQQQTQQRSNSINNNSGQLDNIFNSVKRQIDQWGEHAKWKIDLVLLDNPQQQQQRESLHPLLSPQHFHPNAITTPSRPHTNENDHTKGEDSMNTSLSLPVTSTIQYPWDYVAPTTNDWRQNSDDLQQKLRESIERQKYLESVIWTQAEQIKNSATIVDKDHAISTMKSIFLMSQNEQRMHYLLESNLLHRDIETLSKKLQKTASILKKIETMQVAPEDTLLDKEALLNDRKTLLRKLHLAELRLTARDAEIDYLHEVIDTLKSNALYHHAPSSPFINSTTTSPKPQASQLYGKKTRKGPPYLFQQQYSPRSEVRSSEQHPLSGLDSLGIVADQMLSDPEFETSTSSSRATNEKRLRTRLNDRRSQRSIDSAATLLAMPQLMVPKRSIKEETESVSPEQKQESPLDQHIPKKPRSTYTRWTEAEDAMLRKAVKKYGHSNWEACSKDVHGRSNIQCRNRWIRHLEHRVVEEPTIEEEEEEEAHPYHRIPVEQPEVNKVSRHQVSPPISTNARQSPSIAALLNNSNDNEVYNYSQRTNSKQVYDPSASGGYHIHPNYRPPSPMATPKNKLGAPGDVQHQTHNKW